MDPLSVSSSIVGVLAVASAITERLKFLLKDIKKQGKEYMHLVTVLRLSAGGQEGLREILSESGAILNNLPRQPPKSVEIGLRRCAEVQHYVEGELAELDYLLSPGGPRGLTGSRKPSLSEMRNAMDRLERYSAAFRDSVMQVHGIATRFSTIQSLVYLTV
jgi:hypothetical protein